MTGMSYTATQLRNIADLLDAMDAADPADSRADVFPVGPMRLTNTDGESMGSIADPDGIGYFWTPA